MKKLLTLFIAAFLLVSTLVLTPLTNASALSGSDFKAGNIIDDAVFYNSGALSATEIQNFLNAKMPACDTNGTQSKSYHYRSSDGRINNNADPTVTTTRATYGQRYATWYNAHPYSNYITNQSVAPYTCLKNYKQNTPEVIAESGICGYMPARTSRTGALIIADVASACGINPMVLLVLLQKEQSLLTDDWPWKDQYQKATGFGCPDTSGCNTAYYGFFNQVYRAARQFERYKADPTNWNYVAGQSNKIYYNPNSACGYSWVTIQNQATAGLYNYTPYQPNKAALNNLYGTGDSCSAYGNRNFWRLFIDWFGSVRAPSYSATYATQSAFPSINPGSTGTSSINYKNTGNSAWYDNTSVSGAPAGTKPVHLATTNPINRSSAFSGSAWGAGNNRPAVTFSAVYESDGTTLAANQHVVQPGQIGKFSFTFSVPSTKAAGTYREYFQPIVEGTTSGLFSDPHTWIEVTVPAVYKAAYGSQSAYPNLLAGQATNSYITFSNTSNVTWYDDAAIAAGAPAGTKPVHLATTSPINRASDFSNASWGVNDNRPAVNFATVYDQNGTPYATNPHVVKPGESAKFSFVITAPDTYAAGTYREYFQPVLEGAPAIPVTPVIPWLDATVQSAPSAKAATSSSSLQINPSVSHTATYSFKNSGNISWSQAQTTLRVTSGSAAELRTSGWQSDDVVASLNEASVAPGATGSFTVTYQAPLKNASYAFTLSPFVDSTNISLSSTKVSVNVPTPDYTAKFQNESAFPTIAQNGHSNAFFSAKNTGNVAWYDNTSVSGAPAGTKPVHLATTNPINRSSAFSGSAWGAGNNRPAVTFSAVYESDGTTLAANQHVVQPGQIGKFSFTFSVPSTKAAGTYREYFQPIVEGYKPWSMDLVGWIDVKVTN